MNENPYEPSRITQDEPRERKFGCYQFIAFGLLVFAVLMIFGLVFQGVAPQPIQRPFPPPYGAAK